MKGYEMMVVTWVREGRELISMVPLHQVHGAAAKSRCEHLGHISMKKEGYLCPSLGQFRVGLVCPGEDVAARVCGPSTASRSEQYTNKGRITILNPTVSSPVHPILSVLLPSMMKSRLIHTAPVFEPNSGGVSSVGGVKGFRGENGGIGRNKAGYLARGVEQELERLDEAFMSVGDQVRAQKEAAQKWIRRQRLRMEVRGDISQHTSAPILWRVSVGGGGKYD